MFCSTVSSHTAWKEQISCTVEASLISFRHSDAGTSKRFSQAAHTSSLPWLLFAVCCFLVGDCDGRNWIIIKWLWKVLIKIKFELAYQRNAFVVLDSRSLSMQQMLSTCRSCRSSDAFRKTWYWGYSVIVNLKIRCCYFI